MRAWTDRPRRCPGRLLAKQTQGKLQAQQLLALVAHYARDDVRAAFERAVRFGAFSLAAMRRILAAWRSQDQPPQGAGMVAQVLIGALPANRLARKVSGP